MKANITDSILPRLSVKAKSYDVRDKKLKGFFIRVMPSGVKTYYVEYARGQKIKIGRVDNLSSEEARNEAKVILAGGRSHVKPGSIEDIKKEYRAPTLWEFLDGHYESWVEWNRKSGTRTIKRLKSNFVPSFGHLRINNITPKLIEEWISQKLRKGLTKATLNRHTNPLKACLTKAVEWGLITENPLKDLKQFNVDSLEHVRYLSTEEEERLLLSIKFNLTYLKPLIIVAMNTGMRRGELLQLTWDNVDFKKKLITIKGKTAKSDRTRYIPLNVRALEVLQEWKNSLTITTETVFTYEGRPVKEVKRAFATLLRKAVIKKFRFHDLRHHFASRLVMAGVDLNTVRELLGHTSIDMTLRYAHLAPLFKANAVERLVNSDVKI
jgi:integrase